MTSGPRSHAERTKPCIPPRSVAECVALVSLHVAVQGDNALEGLRRQLFSEDINLLDIWCWIFYSFLHCFIDMTEHGIESPRFEKSGKLHVGTLDLVLLISI